MGVYQAQQNKGTITRLTAAVTFAACVFASNPSVSAPVTINVEPNVGYSRVLVEAETPLGFDARIENSVLVVTFDDTVEFDLRDLKRQAEPFAAMVRRDRDGKTLRLALKRNYRLATSAADNKIALDVIGPGIPGTPPALQPEFTPDELAARDEAARLAEEVTDPIEIRPVEVRVGRQDDYSRVSFDFQEPVNYTATLENGLAKVTFMKAADPDIVELRVDPPAFITSAEKSVSGDMTNVELRVEQDAGMRHFRDGRTIVIDIVKPEIALEQMDDSVAVYDDVPVSEVPDDTIFLYTFAKKFVKFTTKCNISENHETLFKK